MMSVKRTDYGEHFIIISTGKVTGKISREDLAGPDGAPLLVL